MEWKWKWQAASNWDDEKCLKLNCRHQYVLIFVFQSFQDIYTLGEYEYDSDNWEPWRRAACDKLIVLHRYYRVFAMYLKNSKTPSQFFVPFISMLRINCFSARINCLSVPFEIALSYSNTCDHKRTPSIASPSTHRWQSRCCSLHPMVCKYLNPFDKPKW
jgi:hypothetical protein